MDSFSYWQKQGKKPLFSEIDTIRPEQRRLAGRLLIIGGNKGAFFAVATVAETAKKLGVGELRVLMPEALKKLVPTSPETYFAPAEASGAFSRAALEVMLAQAGWAEMVVLAGDVGKNAETATVVAEFLARCEKPVMLTRDAVDAVQMDAANWLLRERGTYLFMSLPQLQKMCRTIYYPRVIGLSMPMNQLVETLHKFTMSYAVTVVTAHEGQIVLAEQGQIVATAMEDTEWTPIRLWSGELAAKMAVFALWNREQRALKAFSRAVL